MGTISLQIPVSGLPNSTEDPKIISDFATLQTLANGNIDTNNLSPSAGITDAQLASPNSASRRLVARVSGSLQSGFPLGDYIFTAAGAAAQSGALFEPVPTLSLDASTFSVPGKTTKFLLRSVAIANAQTTSGLHFSGGLYNIASTSGSVATGINYAFGAGTYTASTVVNWSGGAASDSASAFSLPSAGFYVLGASINVALTANSCVHVTTSLYAVFI